MSDDDILRRLQVLEMALGIEELDREYCLANPLTHCQMCPPERCPAINNLLQVTANQVQSLGVRVRRLELWLEQTSMNESHRELAKFLQKREQVAADIQDVEYSIQRAQGTVAQNLVRFLAIQRAKLKHLDAQIGQLQHE